MTTAQSSDQPPVDEEAARWFTLRRACGCETLEAALSDTADETAFRAWLDADVRHRAAFALMERTFDSLLWALPRAKGE